MHMRFCILVCLSFLLTIHSACSQNKAVNNWTPDQLQQPADLAKRINENKNIPVIINVGPRALIPHSLDAGMTDNATGIKNLKSILAKLNKNADIVIYCGCCPFADCPNVRPAIQVLKENKFTNYHLLNLPQNIHADWISKGYPVIKK